MALVPKTILDLVSAWLWKTFMLLWIYPVIYVLLVKMGMTHDRESVKAYIICCLVAIILASIGYFYLT